MSTRRPAAGGAREGASKHPRAPGAGQPEGPDRSLADAVQEGGLFSGGPDEERSPKELKPPAAQEREAHAGQIGLRGRHEVQGAPSFEGNRPGPRGP